MHQLAKALAALTVVVGIIVLSMSPALAHTAFESSDPGDEAQVDDPVAEIRLTFAGEAAPVGEGFAALDGDGTIRMPTNVFTDDQLTYLLTFEPPLSGGQIGVRWSVTAPDTHPIDGTFTLTVGNTVPAEASSQEPKLQSKITMKEFLGKPEHPRGVALVGGFGRVLALGGALLAIGGAVFAAFVLHGTKEELSTVVRSIKGAAWLVVVGAATELVAQIALVNDGWGSMGRGDLTDVIASSFGIAVALKMIGGWMMSRADVTLVAAADAVDPVLSLHRLAPVGAGPIEAARPNAPLPLPDGATPERHDFVWRSRGNSLAVPIGVAAVLVAFLFDGHTVTEGNRALTGIVNVVHVAAGAVWAGGLVMMAQVIRRRHRRGDDSPALELAVRFSVVAAIALTAAGIAGAALTVIIIESVSDIWTTSWGQLLMAKTVLVAVAGLAGLYNHRVLIPKLAGEDDMAVKAEGEFRRAAFIEAAIIGSVVVATALLVAASSV